MIKYHGVPITGESDPIFSLQGKHACVSFANHEQVELVAELCQSFIIDNGAFSAWKSNKPFDIDGFAAFIEKWHRHPGMDWYLMPDVIDGTDEENIQMQAKWFAMVGADIWRKGVPVWHLNESFQTLKVMSNTFKRVAFGSAGAYAQIGSASWWNRMAEAMHVVCDSDGYPRLKLHGLRMLDPTVFSHFPFSSADSTNVARNCGLDTKWNGPYAPRSRRMRAAIMIERIEAHAAANRWAGSGFGASQNLELFG